MSITITGGKYQGRRIASPKGDAVRPTTGMMRESLFSMLQSRGLILAACFLDLFSGTGIMGLEALSRGASHITVVEKNRQQVNQIEKNYQAILGEDATDKVLVTIHNNDVLKFLSRKNPDAPFDVVFMDPPYGFENFSDVLNSLAENNWVSEERSCIIIEYGSTEPAIDADNFQRKMYGDSSLSIRWPVSV